MTEVTHVPAELYGRVVANFPQVCVELVVEHDDGVLLARRDNEPAKGEWFWPGGRLFKGEVLEDAVHRIAEEELGIDVEIRQQLGVHAHFWETSDVVGNPSRHTVNVVFLVTPLDDDPPIELDDQHTEYRILGEPEPDLHEYVRRYVEEYELLRPVGEP